MPFDPNKPFEPEGGSGGFDPTKPFEPVGTSTPAPKRGLGERLVDNVSDAFQRSGAGQLARRVDPDPGVLSGRDLLDIQVRPGSIADRALQSFGVNVASDELSPAETQERARRTDFEARSKADPFYRASDSTGGKVAAAIATGGGQLVGSALSPENWVAPGRSLLTRAAGNAGVAAGTDVLLQGGDVTAGVQDEYSPLQTTAAGVTGGALSLGFDGARKLGDLIAQIAPARAPSVPRVDPAMGPVETLPPVQAELPAEAVVPQTDIGIPITEKIPPVTPPVSAVIPEAPPLPVGAVDPNAPPPEVAAMPQPVVEAWIEGKPEAGVGRSYKEPLPQTTEPPAAVAAEGPEMVAKAPVETVAPEVASPDVGQGRMADVEPNPPSPASVLGVDETPVMDVVPGDGPVKSAASVVDSREPILQQEAPPAEPDGAKLAAESAGISDPRLEAVSDGYMAPSRAEALSPDVGDNVASNQVNSQQLSKAADTDPSAKATDDLTDADIEALYNKNFAPKTAATPGTKLMSGVDPEDVKGLLVDPAVKVIKKEIDAFKVDAEQVARDFRGLKENVSASKALDTLATTGRKIWWSNTAAIRAVAAKHKDVPEVQKLADMVGTDPGRGRVVEQTYERAVQMRAMGMANRATNVLGEKIKPEFETRVADALAGRIKPVGGSSEEETARRIRKLLDEQHEYLTAAGVDVGYVKGRYYPRIVDEEAVLKDPIAFKEKAAEVYRKMDMDDAEATQAAEDWYSRILGVQNGAYASGLPSSKSTKGRTLPAEADEILKDFYSRDPRANLTAYFRQTSQAAEFARRFGANGEKVDELFNNMLKKGVPPKEVDNLRHHFESAAGLLYRTRPDAGASALSWIQTAGVLRLLPRAVISSAVEGLATGIRAHDVGAGFKAMADSYATVFGMRAPDDMKATAEMLGIVGDAMNDLVISANFGGEVSGQLQQKLLSRFFKTTQLHQITEAQRLAAARVGQGALRTMMQDVVSGNSRKKSAARWLSELGIPEADVPTLAKWVSSDDGRIPFADLLGEKREAVQYRTALQRFVDESIQNPTAADKPQWAGHPFGRLAFGITAFMFSFTRNVLIRTARETGEGVFGKGYTAADRARLLTPALMLGILTAAQSQVSELREMLLNPGAAEKTTLQRVVQNLSRAGAFGNADPFINIALSARYNRDLTSSLTGPYLTAYLDSISKMTIGLIPKEWGGPNTPNTNNAEWQATKAAYEMIAAPAIAAAASYAPGGPLLRVGYGAGLIKATSPGASKGVADAIVGPRDVKPRAKSVAQNSDVSSDLSTIDDDLLYTPSELESEGK